MKTVNEIVAEKEIDGVVASILREYVATENIDFVGRSGAAKGTIDWSNYVARHIKNNKNTCYDSIKNLISFALTSAVEGMREEVEKKYTFHKVDWGDGIVTDEPVEDEAICLAEAQGYNRAKDEVSAILTKFIGK